MGRSSLSKLAEVAPLRRQSPTVFRDARRCGESVAFPIAIVFGAIVALVWPRRVAAPEPQTSGDGEDARLRLAPGHALARPRCPRERDQKTSISSASLRTFAVSRRPNSFVKCTPQDRRHAAAEHKTPGRQRQSPSQRGTLTARATYAEHAIPRSRHPSSNPSSSTHSST